MIARLAPYRKAVIGGVAAGLAAAAQFWGPSTTAGKAIVIALAVLAGAGLVYAVPNRPVVEAPS